MRITCSVFLITLSLGIASCTEVQAEDICNFSDYPTTVVSEGFAKDVDLSSHEDAKNFRTALREGFKRDANAAGHYVVVTHGCGTACQQNWIVDKLTGKVADVIGSSAGLSYELDSKLFIVEVPEGTSFKPACYLLENGTLRKITDDSNEE